MVNQLRYALRASLRVHTLRYRKKMPTIHKILADVETSIDEASCHYEIWWALGSANRQHYSEILKSERYGWFLESTQIAHLVAMLMSLARLFDSHEDSSSCVKSLKKVLDQENRHELTQLIEGKMKPHQNLVKRVLDIRCKLMAHTDSRETDVEVFNRNGTTPKEIKNLIADAKQVFGEVAWKLNIRNRSYTTGIHEDSTIKVLEKLKL